MPEDLDVSLNIFPPDSSAFSPKGFPVLPGVRDFADLPKGVRTARRLAFIEVFP